MNQAVCYAAARGVTTLAEATGRLLPAARVIASMAAQPRGRDAAALCLATIVKPLVPAGVAVGVKPSWRRLAY